MLAQEVIRIKRDGGTLGEAQIDAWVRGLVAAPESSGWSEGQVAAMAMAVFLRGMSRDETVALTRAMQHSGQVLRWDAEQLGGPALDKHSTGGVGDKVSLMLAPIVAACGGFVPMISGRGLGHTGGTLDKLEAIPGYDATPEVGRLRRVVAEVGCAIVGQTAELAPADRRLYAIRDVTATVESVPLITASILSKKLAAGLHGLVMDVKFGNGAFASEVSMARELAASIVQVAAGAGLPARALLTDMNQVLGTTCGHTLELREAIDYLVGGDAAREPRLHQVTRELSAELLVLGGLASDLQAARGRVDRVLADGSAAERFARMVAALGGPADLLQRPADHLPMAPVTRAVPALGEGRVAATDARGIGLLLIELDGGRRVATDRIDPRVGLSAVRSVGAMVQAGEALAVVHAADAAAADAAVARLQQLIRIEADRPGSAHPAGQDGKADPADRASVILERLGP